jgi:hypothetical protein
LPCFASPWGNALPVAVALLGEVEEIELLLQIRQKKKLTARGNVSTRITEGGGVVKGFSHHFLEEK